MPVFISHKDSDAREAIELSIYLQRRDIKNYVDVLDKESQTTDDITSIITRRIRECTHLIAIMSNNTARSWWVPFEIGEATFALRRISSYDIGAGYEFPAYLRKWPVMRKKLDLELFVKAYKSDVANVTRLNDAINDIGRRALYNSDSFHRSLKSEIEKYR